MINLIIAVLASTLFSALLDKLCGAYSTSRFLKWAANLFGYRKVDSVFTPNASETFRRAADDINVRGPGFDPNNLSNFDSAAKAVNTVKGTDAAGGAVRQLLQVSRNDSQSRTYGYYDPRKNAGSFVSSATSQALVVRRAFSPIARAFKNTLSAAKTNPYVAAAVVGGSLLIATLMLKKAQGKQRMDEFLNDLNKFGDEIGRLKGFKDLSPVELTILRDVLYSMGALDDGKITQKEAETAISKMATNNSSPSLTDGFLENVRRGSQYQVGNGRNYADSEVIKFKLIANNPAKYMPVLPGFSVGPVVPRPIESGLESIPVISKEKIVDLLSLVGEDMTISETNMFLAAVLFSVGEQLKAYIDALPAPVDLRVVEEHLDDRSISIVP